MIHDPQLQDWIGVLRVMKHGQLSTAATATGPWPPWHGLASYTVSNVEGRFQMRAGSGMTPSVPVTAQNLLGVPDLSAHQKLSLLATAGEQLAAHRAAFLFGQFRQLVKARPIAKAVWIAFEEGNVPGRDARWMLRRFEPFGSREKHVLLEIGDNGCSGHKGKFHTAEVRDAEHVKIGCSVGKRNERGGAVRIPQINTITTNGKKRRRTTCRRVDALLRTLFEVLVDLAPDCSDVASRTRSTDDVAARLHHPRLDGLDVREDIRPILRQLLGRPYDEIMHISKQREDRMTGGWVPWTDGLAT